MGEPLVKVGDRVVASHHGKTIRGNVRSINSLEAIHVYTSEGTKLVKYSDISRINNKQVN